MKIMNDVLLTYGWVRSSYNALRNLKKHNINVIASDSDIFGMCQFSRLSSGFERYTSHYIDEKKFISDILRICREKNIKLIFPSHNETEIIARHREVFDEEMVALLPEESHCKIFNNKSDAYDLVGKLDIPTPNRIHYSDPKMISDILNEAKINKTVIKLLTGNSGKGVFYAYDANDAQSIAEKLIEDYKLNKNRYPQIEEFVEGDGYGCSVLYWQGREIASFTHKRLREKIITGGTSTFREASNHKGIAEATKKIFDKVKWNGLAMCEFKVCPKSGRFWFIEVNPRMWGSIPLAIESGVEFPYLAWLCANNGPQSAIKYHSRAKRNKNWKARWVLGDIFLVLESMLKLKFGVAWSILVEKKADSLDDFFWDDPLVFIGEALAYIKTAICKRSINSSEEGMIG